MQVKLFAQILIHISQDLWNKLSKYSKSKKTSGILHALFKPINHLYKKIEVAL